ncbi:MAG: hypothetical protein AAF570_15830 [Bacteroidota bacterium]
MLASQAIIKDTKEQAKVDKKIKAFKKFISTFEKAIADADAIDPASGDFHKLSEDKANVYTYVYRALPETLRDEIDKELGINRYADPEIGQGYTTVRGGDQVLKADGSVDGSANWNFHWGGVIMKSGSDNLTLENDAGTSYASGPDNTNNLWRFHILGTKKKGQSFHEHHQYAHGTDPTTMVVKGK